MFDLIALHMRPELDVALRRLFQAGGIVKLSMDGSQDLKKLASGSLCARPRACRQFTWSRKRGSRAASSWAVCCRLVP